MNLVIFGANGPTGRLLTKQVLASGHAVTAVTRHPETFPLQNARLQVMRADVFDLSSVEQAVAGQDAVLSTLGVPYSFKPITLYSQGMAHIVQAMNHYSVRRLVCVSSSASDPQTRYHDTGGGFIFENILKPIIINSIGRTMYADMQRMETLVRNSHLDWTIVRPSGLFETEAITHYQVADTHADFTDIHMLLGLIVPRSPMSLADRADDENERDLPIPGMQHSDARRQGDRVRQRSVRMGNREDKRAGVVALLKRSFDFKRIKWSFSISGSMCSILHWGFRRGARLVGLCH